MPRVVPSQVVETIEKLYYTKEGGDSEWPKDIPMNQAHCATMGAILSLVQQIPNEFITLDAEQFFRFEASRQAIQAAIEKSMGQRLDEAGVHPIHLSPIPGLGSENPIRLLHSCLAQCPDEFPSSQTAELLFIERDSAYRESLRQDTSSMNHALAMASGKPQLLLRDHCWKPCCCGVLRNTEIRQSQQQLPLSKPRGNFAVTSPANAKNGTFQTTSRWRHL